MDGMKDIFILFSASKFSDVRKRIGVKSWVLKR